MPDSSSDVHVREMRKSDATAVALLLPHLGYFCEPHDVEQRLEALARWPDNAAFVVEQDGKLLGLLQIHGVRLLASDGYAEVAALVVHLHQQRRGLGSLLILQAVAWADHYRYARVRLRSGVHRHAAHEFYVSLGFSQSRASYAFEQSFASR